MPSYSVDPAIQAEARRRALEDLDRDLGSAAELLAGRGYHSPDSRPYPTQEAIALRRTSAVEGSNKPIVRPSFEGDGPSATSTP